MTEVFIRDIIAWIERIAPPAYALGDDPIGLQVGRTDRPAKRVWLALDPSPEVIRAACADRADLLITHHPLLYRPLTRIDTSTARGQAVAQALAHGLTVYAAHTNLDVAEGGVNDALAELLGLREVEILDKTKAERLRKLVVFVPESHHEAVFRAVCEAGAGHIGAYSHCTFNVTGTGTFLPHTGTNPYVGQAGRLERVPEVRLETIVPEHLQDDVIRAMRAAHPYEEVAYDLYPLEILGHAVGIGRVGNLPQPMQLCDFAEFARDQLGLSHIRFGGEPHLQVRRAAVLGGSGRHWVKHALAADAQVLVTSDCDHHTVAEAWQDGLAVVDATHAALERPVLAKLKAGLEEQFGSAVDVVIAPMVEDPFYWL